MTELERNSFIELGFVKIEAAFDAELAERGRRIIWADMKMDPTKPDMWTEPVVRLVPSDNEPFGLAVNTALLRSAYNELVGENWYARPNAGAFVVRFPSSVEPNDTGWHIDGSFLVGDQYFINLYSRERALLMLFLFSDVDENDAPTRIRSGSHLDVPRFLVAAGENGLSFNNISMLVNDATQDRPVALATGKAGDVYLCHPFLVHAAQKNNGPNVRFMAQPPLTSKAPFQIDRVARDYCPAELAIRKALDLTD